jgi:putative ABC transport system permease protein
VSLRNSLIFLKSPEGGYQHFSFLFFIFEFFMNVRDIYRLSTRSLSANKKRAALTMLGIIIGITSVIVIMAVGAGAQSLVLNQIKSQGTDLIGILPGGSDDKNPPASAMGIQITTLTYDDTQAIKNKANVPHAKAVAAYVSGTGSITWENRSIDNNYFGASADFLTIENLELASGRFFTAEEERGLARVVVLGSTVASDLFDQSDPLGQKIKIGKESFSVIGVFKKAGVSGFMNKDKLIVLPLFSAQKLLLGINHVSFVRVKVDEAANIDKTKEDIIFLLRQRHDITDPTQDDFSVRSSQQMLDVFTSITDILKYFLAAIAAIALLVGGVGIMNIMLVAVTERTREIGLRKAVGATGSNVMAQFLVEAVILTLSAGVVGIIIGSVISTLVALVARYLGYNWDLVISLTSIFLACGVCILIGLVFGYYPARRAARLNPIDALRYE